MIGTALGKALESCGHRILTLVRKQSSDSSDSASQIVWNPKAGQLPSAPLEGISAAIHLSGANVSTHRWTDSYKREIEESRILSTRLLAETLARLKTPPRALLVASAIGYYGDRGGDLLSEDSPAGKGYFPRICSAWEDAAQPAAAAGIRLVHLRFGVVLGPDGGALARLIPMFRLGLGGKLGSGRQWMSWISEADAISAALFALDHPSLRGPVNVTAPQPVTNQEFTHLLARAVHRPAIFNAPAFALRLAFGEMADEALLSSTRAVPTRLLESGFAFNHPTLDSALQAAVTNP